jgi:hypothetical protein
VNSPRFNSWEKDSENFVIQLTPQLAIVDADETLLANSQGCTVAKAEELQKLIARITEVKIN